MAEYYCDPGASGSNDGTTWGNAWDGSVSGSALQDAIDGANGTAPAAGDTVYCRGTDTPTSVIQLDNNSGDETRFYIKFIGTNASGNIDGTKFAIDATSVSNCLQLNAVSMSYIWFENFEFKNATSHGIDSNATTAQYFVFVHCDVHDNGGSGFNAIAQFERTHCFQCRFYDNASTGADRLRTGSIFAFCEFYGNGSYGYGTGYDDTAFYGCIFADNVNAGYSGNAGVDGQKFINCVFDGYNSTTPVQDAGAIFSTARQQTFIGCRLTYHTADTGFGVNPTLPVHLFSNYFGGNDTDESLANFDIPLYSSTGRTADSNTWSGADTNQGYTTLGSDWNLRTDATIRSVAVELD